MSALRHKYSKASNRKFVKYVMVLIIKKCLTFLSKFTY